MAHLSESMKPHIAKSTPVHYHSSMGVLENAVSLSLEEGKARKFLSNRQILAVMLKKFVSEFKGCTVADIETKYIEADIHTKQKFNEEVDTMCNYSDWIESKGIAKGIGIGREEGIGIGREEGIGIGREEGIGIGREEGLQKGREMLIISLDRQGVARETIAAAAGLTVEQVAAIIDAAAVTA